MRPELTGRTTNHRIVAESLSATGAGVDIYPVYMKVVSTRGGVVSWGFMITSRYPEVGRSLRIAHQNHHYIVPASRMIDF